MTRVTLTLAVSWAAMAFAGLLMAAEPAAPTALSLSGEEKAWLAAHPVIRVGYDPAFPPFCFRDANGRPQGIDADLLAGLERRLGVRFEWRTAVTWSAVYSLAERHQVDVLTSTAELPERRPYFLFTRPYVQFAVTIVTRSDGPFAVTEGDLHGMRVAGPRDYAPTLAFRRAYPDVTIAEFNSVAEALRAVADGRCDAVVTNLANASYLIKTHGLANLKIAGVIPEVFEERLAVRSDWPVLARILDHAIAAVPPPEMAGILDRWVKVDYAAVVRWDFVRRWTVVGLLFVGTIVALIVWHNLSLRGELEKRRRVQEELEQVNRRLKAANLELAQRHDEKSELMRVAAHDLRGPLAAIMLCGEALREEPAAAVIDAIEGSARRMSQLIEDLLHVHAMEEGQRIFRHDRLAIVDTVRAAAATFQPAADRKQITLDLSGLNAVGEVLGDDAALRQVFENLISNALKFSPAGTTVRVRSSVWQEHVRIEVQDEGPGVRPDERERIFTKYGRGSAQPTGGEKSTGLGLAIVREIISASNGRVWCDRAPTGGAIFVVVLPRALAVV